MPADLNVVVLAAGESKRMAASPPAGFQRTWAGPPLPPAGASAARSKVLMKLWGRTSVSYAVDAALALDPARLVVVVGGRTQDDVKAALAGRPRVTFARQDEPRGTGHAVMSARAALGESRGALLVLYGDCPLVTIPLLSDLLAAHRASAAALTVLTAELADATSYGRIVRDERGDLRAIVEERDADAATRAIREVNTGVWVLEVPAAFEDLAGVGTANAQQEMYLTDLVALARQRGRRVAAARATDPDDVLGFNTPADLARVREVLRRRILDFHLQMGVEIVDPATTFIDADVAIEPGARIEPCTVIEGDSRIGAGCEVGPFAHLRTGSVLEAGAEVGNFTELKKSVLGPGSKAKHLSYIGDTRIGARTNIGAGTITANYDGRAKHKTEIGAGAFIGSGTVLVAPVTVEDEATTGAGAVVTRNAVVKSGETWVGMPARPIRKPGASDEPADQAAATKPGKTTS